MGVVSRRRFLGSAAALPLALRAPLAERITAVAPARGAIQSGCLLVDLQEHCVLTESLAGFARGFDAASIPYSRVTADALRPARLIVVPGAFLLSSEFAATLSHFCKLGSTVIYESGAAYAGEKAFRIEQRLLRDHFDLAVDKPVELWNVSKTAVPNSPPYVHYHWPCQAIVRDFSRAIPVTGTPKVSAGEPATMEANNVAFASSIARIGSLPVCTRVRAARGEFIFLGSPLGPHLASGDQEAKTLLKTLAFTKS